MSDATLSSGVAFFLDPNKSLDMPRIRPHQTPSCLLNRIIDVITISRPLWPIALSTMPNGTLLRLQHSRGVYDHSNDNTRRSTWSQYSLFAIGKSGPWAFRYPG